MGVQAAVKTLVLAGKWRWKKGWLRAWSGLRNSLRRRPVLWAAGLSVFVAYAFCVPATLFDAPVSTVLLDRDGKLLGARIAADGQWRFPAEGPVPEKFARALIAFEDKRFYRHWGVDPLALARALRLNFRRGGIASGGSTLTMQVARMMAGSAPRTLPRKVLEMVQATRLEFRFSKKSILRIYAANAPFGGNVVGLDAAAWKYFGRPAEQLSWAEAATLAVLPNAPALVHPGRNRETLRRKRDVLLNKLRQLGQIDSLTCALAKMEPLPEQPLPLPALSPHLLDRAHADRLPAHAGQIRVTISSEIQALAMETVRRHHERLRQNGIFHAAALIMETHSGEVLAYVGNAPLPPGAPGGAVDIVRRPRSSGSILKPFLYASMLQSGELLPGMLSPDVPTYFRSFSPANFDRQYRGAVPAAQALARSLNVPAVRWLQTHGVARFYDELKSIGLTTLRRPPDHYGLSLILGGAETTLWDLAGAYAGLGRVVLDYAPFGGAYAREGFRPPTLYLDEKPRLPSTRFTQESPVTAGAAWLTLQALTQVNRPEEDINWQYFPSSRRVAWKTGTSYGFRDAWAAGVTPAYTVAVWVGNASGEGRPDLVGGTAAAPLFFELLGLLPPETGWFPRPDPDLERIAVCAESGHRPGQFCPHLDTVWACPAGEQASACPYHALIHTDPTGRWRVHSACEQIENMTASPWFILPPVMAHYYQIRRPDYEPPPPYRSDCPASGATEPVPFEWVYPSPGARVFVPVELDGSRGKAVFEVAHRRREETLYWHLDETYLGETRFIHQIALAPAPGPHVLTVVDAYGAARSVNFEVISSPIQPVKF